MLVDTHAHLDFPEFSEDLDGVLERASKAGVCEIVTIGIDLASSRKAVELADAHPGIFATVGIHPHDAFLLNDRQLKTLETLSREKRVLAVGEVGLDYYRDRQPRKLQQQCLRQQLELACSVGLPVVFHVREAHVDFLEIIKDYARALSGGVLHCFSGDWTVAKSCLDMGFYLSIPGTVTFPRAETQHEVVKRAPLDRLLLETDAPYLAPVPFRGKVNEPAFVVYAARKVADLRHASLEEIAHQTTINAHKVFRIENKAQ